jgi:hypothetical protein
LIAHGFVERMVDELIRAKCKHGGQFVRFQHATKLHLLHELGLLSDSLYQCLTAFKKMRNEAAHGLTFVVDPRSLKVLVPAGGVLGSNQDLRGHCLLLIGTFWNLHLPVFGPKFAPGVVGVKKAKPESMA